MTAIARLTRAEVRKLATTRAFLISLAIAIGLAVISIVVDAVEAGTNHNPALGTTASTYKMLKIGAVCCVAMLILGIMASGGEYRHKTIITATLITPPAAAPKSPPRPSPPPSPLSCSPACSLQTPRPPAWSPPQSAAPCSSSASAAAPAGWHRSSVTTPTRQPRGCAGSASSSHLGRSPAARGGGMNETCDRCGPAVRAAYRASRGGQL